MSSDLAETEWQRWKFEQDRQIAERHHDREIHFADQSNQSAIEASNLTLRALILINGGAAIAVLAFLGGIIAADTGKYLDDAVRVSGPIIFFAWGVALATLGNGFAYITNYCITAAIYGRTHAYDKPYVADNDCSKRWARWGVGVQFAAIFAAVASLVCFLVGMYTIRDAIAFLQ